MLHNVNSVPENILIFNILRKLRFVYKFNINLVLIKKPSTLTD